MPLSVSPSSSVYMKHIVEIEPGEHGDRVAFVRANISHTTDVSTSLYAFKSRLMARSGKARQPLIGYEIVLGLKGNALPEDETAALIDSLIGQRLDLDVSLADHIDSATLGFHMMGISPTRAVRIKYVFPAAGSQCRSLCWVLFPYERITNWRVLLWGYPIPSWKSPDSHNWNAWVLWHSCLYSIVGVLIKQEEVVEQQTLPSVFDKAIWTFSDSRYAEHRALDLPVQGVFVSASPASFNASQKRRRQIITLVACGGLTGSCAVFYLGIRVAQWWVAQKRSHCIKLGVAWRTLAWSIQRHCLRVPSRNFRYTSNPKRRIYHTRKFQ